ncbi:choline dehydrogenase [Raphidocelis subcapitata]|uniref:Choline dehydrogenase n=1 Tax=Raphidocelis subcapitata TaxID=307507 RepID=A0A2V0NV16_9CHLO|nr:choline dehydrogenase [Raphidocelis subcapitata]|eukprot:GBF88787.1 choline dehydrogenase [Raphidocelis subcapitata]
MLAQTSRGAVRPAAAAQKGRTVSLRAAARRRAAVVVRAAASPVDGKYDYVIVGGGTAGCVLANRLTADGGKRVLVLESGGNGGALETRVPAALARLFRHPTLDWNLFSALQARLGEREVYLARGKLLGGSSATNATLYLRGTPADYDAWALPGWGAGDVLPWFVEAETNSKGASPYHGSGGLMRVESPRYVNPLHAEFFAAAKAAGLEANGDFNDWGRPQEGFGEYQVTQNNGRRADAFQTHLKPAMGRPNLTVVTGTHVTRLGLESSGAGKPRAVGVEFSTGRAAQADRFTAELAPGGEVLMCSGTVANPQLLMLSGIGPEGALRDLGLPVVAAAEGVGANLQDHPATLFAALSKPEYQDMYISSEIYGIGGTIRLGAIAQLLLQGRGPLATTGCDRGAFVNTRGGSGDPDLQIRFVPGYALDPDAIQSYVKYGQLRKEGKAWPGGITMQLLTARPKSRGRVGLYSADPFAPPKVDLGYFSDAGGADLATLLAGIKLARSIAEQAPLAKYLKQEGWPGADVQSEADLEAYVRRSACSGNALVGSCRMGAAPTDGSVVSAQDFSVWGVDALRVVDASVIPTIPGGQTGAATVMVAERAAALLTGAGAPRRGGAAAGAKAAALA